MKNGAIGTSAAFALMAVAIVLAVTVSYSRQPATHTISVVETATASVSTTVTSVVEYGNLEQCTYTATSEYEYPDYGDIRAILTTTTTISYFTTATNTIIAGSVVTTSTSPYQVVYGANGQIIGLENYPPYIGEPYSVSCTLVTLIK